MMISSGRFPQELYELIIDYLYEPLQHHIHLPDDPFAHDQLSPTSHRDLATCTLVCRTFVAKSRSLAFASIHLGISQHRRIMNSLQNVSQMAMRLVELIQEYGEASTFLSHITRLYLVEGVQDFGEPIWLNEFIVYIGLFTKITTLQIRFAQFQAIPKDVWEDRVQIGLFNPNLTSLSLDSSCLPTASVLLRGLGTCIQLVHLNILAVSAIEIDTSSVSIPPSKHEFFSELGVIPAIGLKGHDLTSDCLNWLASPSLTVSYLAIGPFASTTAQPYCDFVQIVGSSIQTLVLWPLIGLLEVQLFEVSRSFRSMKHLECLVFEGLHISSSYPAYIQTTLIWVLRECLTPIATYPDKLILIQLNLTMDDTSQLDYVPWEHFEPLLDNHAELEVTLTGIASEMNDEVNGWLDFKIKEPLRKRFSLE